MASFDSDCFFSSSLVLCQISETFHFIYFVLFQEKLKMHDSKLFNRFLVP
uniref:Uncharacterized protein n=1 Tax=Anguilla anguilla TaxID=7936 RepID=A0A0E9PXI6_ANGAN